MEKFADKLKYREIWEYLIFPENYSTELPQSYSPAIFFVITGSVDLKINNRDLHSVFSHEMFVFQNNNLYEIKMLEQTHLLICNVPSEFWYAEQERINELIPETLNLPEEFFKLPVKEMIIRFLSLLEFYLEEDIHNPYFFEIKLKELFFLLFLCYQKHDLTRFLCDLVSEDVQFKIFVLNNYSVAENVQELAKLSNYSTSGFIKKFQRCFRMSPYKWMQKQKAKQISLEIFRGNKSLQEIANEYKFSSYQHFSAFCKAQLGAPPTTISAKIRLKSV